MICVVSDTHRETDHGLPARTLDAVRGADLTVHAGDFTAPAVLDAFEAEAGRLAAVHGNSDHPAVRDRLPAERVVEADGLRIAVVHGHRHDATALSLHGRSEGADLVVSGHTHRPSVEDADEVTLLTPGSPTAPRGARPTHAELRVEEGRGAIVAPDGTVVAEFDLPT